MTPAERVRLLEQLQADEKARRRDLPDLLFFMLATGVRIGEPLAAVWSEVDFEAGTAQITSTLVRVGSGPTPGVLQVNLSIANREGNLLNVG